MTFNRCHRTMAGILLLVACVPGVRRDGVAADGRVSRSPLPRSTSGEIIPRDLRARLEVLAHDSMMGREAGTMGNFIASEYLAAEARRIGLTPAGADGSWFQAIPLGRLGADTAGHITAGDVALKVGRDVVPIPSVGGLLPFSEGGSLDGVLAVYGGRLQEGDGPLSEGQVDGKLVVFDTPQTDDGKPLFNFATPPLLEALGRLQNAAGIAVTTLDITPARVVAMLSDLNEAMLDPADPSPRRPIGFIVTRAAASALMGRPLEGLTVGTGGETLHGRVNPVFVPAQYPARNVVAVLRGSDPQLRREYIAVVAHSDHEGFAPTPVDHDSVLAHNTVLRPWGADSAARPETPDRLARVRAIRDSLARVGAGPLDSILNGADDDGSGSVALLEIAEAFVQSGRQPRRSLRGKF